MDSGRPLALTPSGIEEIDLGVDATMMEDAPGERAESVVPGPAVARRASGHGGTGVPGTGGSGAPRLVATPAAVEAARKAAVAAAVEDAMHAIVAEREAAAAALAEEEGDGAEASPYARRLLLWLLLVGTALYANQTLLPEPVDAPTPVEGYRMSVVVGRMDSVQRAHGAPGWNAEELADLLAHCRPTPQLALEVAELSCPSRADLAERGRAVSNAAYGGMVADERPAPVVDSTPVSVPVRVDNLGRVETRAPASPGASVPALSPRLPRPPVVDPLAAGPAKTLGWVS